MRAKLKPARSKERPGIFINTRGNRRSSPEYVVFGSTIFKVRKNGNAKAVGDAKLTSSKRTWRFSFDASQVAALDDGYGWAAVTQKANSVADIAPDKGYALGRGRGPRAAGRRGRPMGATRCARAESPLDHRRGSLVGAAGPLGSTGRRLPGERAEYRRREGERYCSQLGGGFGAATLMKTFGPGGRGVVFGCIWISRGRRLPLRRLQGAQEATMFSQTDSPPRLRGITWSTVRPAALAAAVLAGPGVAGEDRLAGDLAAVDVAGNADVGDEPDDDGTIELEPLGADQERRRPRASPPSPSAAAPSPAGRCRRESARRSR